MVSIINEYFGKVNDCDVFLHVDLIDMEELASTKIVISIHYPSIYTKSLISKSIYLKSLNFFSMDERSVILAHYIIDIWVGLAIDLGRQHSLIGYVNKIVKTVLIGIDTAINTNKEPPVIMHAPLADGDRPTGVDNFSDAGKLYFCSLRMEKPYDGLFSIRLYTHLLGDTVCPIQCMITSKDEKSDDTTPFAPGKFTLSYDELLSNKGEEKVQDAIISALEMAGVSLMYIDKRDMRRWKAILTRELKKTILIGLEEEK